MSGVERAPIILALAGSTGVWNRLGLELHRFYVRGTYVLVSWPATAGLVVYKMWAWSPPNLLLRCTIALPSSFFSSYIDQNNTRSASPPVPRCYTKPLALHPRQLLISSSRLCLIVRSSTIVFKMKYSYSAIALVLALAQAQYPDLPPCAVCWNLLYPRSLDVQLSST